MRNSLLFFAAVSLLLASCQKEQLVEEKLSSGVVTEVSATFEALVPDGATKASVSISENTGTFSWQEDDAAAFVLTPRQHMAREHIMQLARCSRFKVQPILIMMPFIRMIL